MVFKDGVPPYDARPMTELFLKLLGAHGDDAVNVAKASLAFRGGVSVGWFIFFILVLGGAVFWMYRNSPVGLSHIFNLGHGILPETPPENVARLVELVRRAKADSQ